jgi:hypothetical protein
LQKKKNYTEISELSKSWNKTARKTVRKMERSVRIYWNQYRLIGLSLADDDDDDNDDDDVEAYTSGLFERTDLAISLGGLHVLEYNQKLLLLRYLFSGISLLNLFSLYLI